MCIKKLTNNISVCYELYFVGSKYLNCPTNLILAWMNSNLMIRKKFKAYDESPVA